MQKKNILIAVIFALLGFFLAYFVFAILPDSKPGDASDNKPGSGLLPAADMVDNPFQAATKSSPAAQNSAELEAEINAIKLQLQDIELTLQELTSDTENTPASLRRVNSERRFSSALTQRLYNLDNLIRGGIDPAIAEDIVRRKNSVELKRLELQDRARRENYLNTEQYFDELEIINQLDVSLREELGDEQYDGYLFNSKQNNRIKISSVMLGSAAELAGIQAGDVVLSYDNVRMFTWQELKDATAEGELGDYVSMSIIRDGEIFSFSVPRGALGVQLGATRLVP